MCRHTANGWQTSTPSVAPSSAFVALRLENEPCAQSWNTMNMRIRNPAATTENAPASHGETQQAAADAPISARYTATDVKRFEIVPRRGTA